MRIFRAVIQIAMLAMLHAWQELALGRPIALQLIRDHHARDVLAAFEELAEELLRGRLISPALDENIQDVAVLIHSPPSVVALAIHCQKHLIEVPLISRLGAAVPQLIGILLSKFPAPLADRLIRHDDASGEEKFLHVAVAQTEPEISQTPWLITSAGKRWCL
jgi:hypothetical protein